MNSSRAGNNLQHGNNNNQHKEDGCYDSCTFDS
jgi:hypothetical protein